MLARLRVMPVLGVALLAALAAAALATTGGGVGAAEPGALTAEDRAEIRDLAGRYSHAIDLGDSAAWAEVFTEDGVMEMAAQGYNITGEQLRGLGADREPAAGGGRHIPTTFVIDGAGDDATMRSYVTVVSTADPARIVFQGRYEDRLRRVDGKWRIAHRKILTDWIDSGVAEAVAESSLTEPAIRRRARTRTGVSAREGRTGGLVFSRVRVRRRLRGAGAQDHDWQLLVPRWGDRVTNT